MHFYKGKCGKPYQNGTRLKRENYVTEVGFCRLLVGKFGTPTGPSISGFFCTLCYFLAQMAQGHVLGRTMSQCTYQCFPGVVLTSTPYNIFFPSHWLLSHITIVETMDSFERGMNPVALTIINQSSERIFAGPGIKPATYCSQVCNATD